MQTIADLVAETFDDFGLSVAQTFVQSFIPKFGHAHPDTIAAQNEIDRLLSAKPSPAQALADLMNNATVVIPNVRSSGETRIRGRSVD